MNLYPWAIRHGVSLAALKDLEAELGLGGLGTMGERDGLSEGAVQNRVRLEAASKGVRLFRNNVGVLKDDTGRPVRYGLANDSKAINEVIKSADLIGWRAVTITPYHVGGRIAQFVSREVKEVGWAYSGTPREEAQKRWALMAAADGADAGFCTGEGTL